MNSPKSLQERLQRIVGHSLTIVSFIHDYIQFDFDGATLTTFTLPSFRGAGSILKPQQPGYCDALCSQIGIPVETANVTDEEISICFDRGAEFSVSLRASDYVGPEAINFDSEDGKVVV